MSWFEKLFINDVKGSLRQESTVSNEQIEIAVSDYLAKNPIESTVAVVENNVLHLRKGVTT